MDFSLKVFTAVAKHLNYTRAGKELSITQPAVSKHINKLEEHFQKRLINRESPNLTLTPEGQLLLTYATRILDVYQELENEFLAIDDKFPARFTLAASTTISQYILPKLLSDFRSLYPETELVLLNGNSNEVESLLLNKQVEVGFTEGGLPNPHLHHVPFLADELVLVTRSNNYGFRKEEISLATLCTLPLVVRESGSGTLKIVEEALKKEGIALDKLNIEMVLGSTEGIKSYLMNTNAFAFLSVHAIYEELKTNRLKVIDVKKMEMKRVFRMVYLHGSQSPQVKVFERFCLNRITKGN